MVPLLHWQRSLSGDGSPQGRRGGESKGPCCCHHAQGTLHARATPARESPKVFGMAEGVAPIPSSGGCWGHLLTNQGPKAKGGIKPALPNDPNKTTCFPSEDPYSTSVLSVNASLGARVAADPTTWFLWGNGLPMHSGTCWGGPWSANRHHAHRTIGHSGDI